MKKWLQELLGDEVNIPQTKKTSSAFTAKVSEAEPILCSLISCSYLTTRRNMQNTETNYLKTTATNCEHIANIQQAFEGCKLSRLLLDRLWWIQTNAAALGGGDGGLDKLCVSCSNTFHKSCISCSDTFQHQASRTKRSHAWKSPKVPPCQNADSGQLWTIQHFGWLEPGLSDRPCSKDLCGRCGSVNISFVSFVCVYHVYHSLRR